MKNIDTIQKVLRHLRNIKHSEDAVKMSHNVMKHNFKNIQVKMHTV